MTTSRTAWSISCPAARCRPARSRASPTAASPSRAWCSWARSVPNSTSRRSATRRSATSLRRSTCPISTIPRTRPSSKPWSQSMATRWSAAMPSFINVEAWDGMEMIFHMLKATGGQPDGDKMMAAVKGYAWNSPRGPVKVDPKTRELIQDDLCPQGREGERPATRIPCSRPIPTSTIPGTSSISATRPNRNSGI